MRAALDHLVIGLRDLDGSLAKLERWLGIRFGPGGAHPAMGTHNRLTRIGPTTYLEAIAIDPTAPAPDRLRWFGLDDPATLFVNPRLLAWVVRVPDVEQALQACPVDLGRPTPMSRGDLHWTIALRPDGERGPGPILPWMISWPDGAGPAATIPDAGLVLRRLTLRHPDPKRIRDMLDAIGAAETIAIQRGDKPALLAFFDKPDGSPFIMTR